MSAPAADPFEAPEVLLAKKLGVQKKRLAAARFHGLIQGVDWAMVRGKVAYAPAGVAKLMLKLGLDTEAPEGAHGVTRPTSNPGPEKKAPAPAPPREGTVVRTFANRHLLEAELDGQTVRVRVRSSKNFKRGMKVPLELLPGDELWTLTRKEPRFPGRW